jgi:hypothetical protein
MKTSFIPNSVLPAGGELIKPIKKKIGGWNELEFDAKVSRIGLTWYRVRGGFGGRGDSEGWIADIVAGNISVCDYNFNDTGFGINYGSFDGACVGQIKSSMEHLKFSLIELRKKLNDKEKALKLLTNISLGNY